MPVIGFIGTGNMGGALASAAAKNPGNTVLLTNRTPAKAELLAQETGAKAVDKEELVSSSDFVFLGVKPQMFENLVSQIRDCLKRKSGRVVLVSMMAGITISQICEKLGDFPVIRIMPNIPVAVGEGMILWDCNGLVNDDDISLFLDSLSAAGRFSHLDEKLIDAGSSVSGCGPAFAAMFIEALADGAVSCGLPRKNAMEYAEQMVIGTAAYLLETGIHPGELKDAVCSPGGTTIQGVRVLEENGFRSAVFNAAVASFEKNGKL